MQTSAAAASVTSLGARMGQAPHKAQNDDLSNSSPNKVTVTDPSATDAKLQSVANEFQTEMGDQTVNLFDRDQNLKTPTHLQQNLMTPTSLANPNLNKQIAYQGKQAYLNFDHDPDGQHLGAGIAGTSSNFNFSRPQFNLSYQSFFNQQNIIGDPIVKPFSLNTPNNANQMNDNYHQNLQASDVKSSSSGQVSASKQIGAHLLQMQQTTVKNQPLRQDASQDLISLLRQLGCAYQLLSDFKCQEAIIEFKKLPSRHQQTSWVAS